MAFGQSESAVCLVSRSETILGGSVRISLGLTAEYEVSVSTWPLLCERYCNGGFGKVLEARYGSIIYSPVGGELIQPDIVYVRYVRALE